MAPSVRCDRIRGNPKLSMWPTLQPQCTRGTTQPLGRMYHNANFGLFALLIVGVLGALALMFASGGHPSESEMREALERELDGFVVPGAVMCGLVPKDGSRVEAINCIQSSISRKVPFVAAFQEQGEDSDVWSGLAGNLDGGLRWLAFDSSPHGQRQKRAGYPVTSRACSGPQLVQVGAGAVRCEQYGQP